jgi:hypothetical protein
MRRLSKFCWWKTVPASGALEPVSSWGPNGANHQRHSCTDRRNTFSRVFCAAKYRGGHSRRVRQPRMRDSPLLSSLCSEFLPSLSCYQVLQGKAGFRPASSSRSPKNMATFIRSISGLSRDGERERRGTVIESLAPRSALQGFFVQTQIPPPVSAGSCSRHVVASPPGPGSHSCHHASSSRRRVFAPTRPPSRARPRSVFMGDRCMDFDGLDTVVFRSLRVAVIKT